jgi:hypothetical protein
LWSFSRAKKEREDRAEGGEGEEGEEVDVGGLTYDTPDSFEVITDPENEYINEIENLRARLYDNDIIFSEEGRLKVPSEEMISLLLKWLEVQKIRNPKVLESYWQNKIIPDVYKTISDFRLIEKQLIFVNIPGLKKWVEKQGVRGTKKKEGVRPGGAEGASVIYHELDTRSKDPYFYQFFGRLSIIQNVEGGGLEQAEYVANIWLKSKRNEGYSPVVKDVAGGQKALVTTMEDTTKTIKGDRPLVGVVGEGEGKEYFAILLL